MADPNLPTSKNGNGDTKDGRQPSRRTMEEMRAESGSPIIIHKEEKTGGLGVSRMALGILVGRRAPFRIPQFWVLGWRGVRLFFSCWAPVSARPADCQQGFRNSASTFPGAGHWPDESEESEESTGECCGNCGTFDSGSSAHPPESPSPQLRNKYSGSVRSPLIPCGREDSTSAKTRPFRSLILWQGAYASRCLASKGVQDKREGEKQGSPKSKTAIADSSRTRVSIPVEGPSLPGERVRHTPHMARPCFLA
ncbi:hypothetical protein B0T25DRAFT_211000 [Lasiosphaeria hispida]|uniref:Uncharacterized protein n=1 Tax=Lasiosphaeria hispida TaxID=260671 RepID=A0AAJ0MEF8_9PEZI|nr:hypothetical protein B0T25DRAFT_211000 [Lasiosphaeria hispida]